MIPRLADLVRGLQKRREAMLALEVEIDTLELVAEKGEGGVAASLSAKVEEYSRLSNQLYSGVDQIHELGCFLKDVDLGLVDFCAVHQGHMVYLCWRLGEPSVGYWHEIGMGYACRQPIPADFGAPVPPGNLEASS